MTIEDVYRAYIGTEGEILDPAIEESIAGIVDLMDSLGAGKMALMHTEEKINQMLCMQEEKAFVAGFRAAFSLALNAGLSKPLGY